MKGKVGVLHPCILQHDPHSSSVPCFGSWPPKRARRRAMSPPRHLLHPQFSRRRAVVGLGSPCCGGWIPPAFPPCLTLVQDHRGSLGGTSLVWPMAVCTHRGARAHTWGFGNIPNTTTSVSHPLHLLRAGLGYFFIFFYPFDPLHSDITPRGVMGRRCRRPRGGALLLPPSSCPLSPSVPCPLLRSVTCDYLRTTIPHPISSSQTPHADLSPSPIIEASLACPSTLFIITSL